MSIFFADSIAVRPNRRCRRHNYLHQTLQRAVATKDVGGWSKIAVS